MVGKPGFMKGLFNRYFRKYDNWYEKNKFAYLSELKAVKNALPKNGIGLEIGVGTGRFAAALGIKYGIDPSSKMLELAQKRGIKTRLGTGEKLPYKNKVFDYVALIITLCFVKNPKRVLRESRRVLKNSGRIIICIVDRSSFLGRFYKKAHFFDTAELTDLLKKAGFNKVNYYQTIFKLPSKIKAVEKPKKGFGKGGFVVISAQKIK